jgi:hypothetical protein
MAGSYTAVALLDSNTDMCLVESWNVRFIAQGQATCFGLRHWDVVDIGVRRLCT